MSVALENYERAIDDFTTAIKLDPNDVESYYNRAFAYREIEDYESALKDFNKTIEIDSEFALVSCNTYYITGSASWFSILVH